MKKSGFIVKSLSCAILFLLISGCAPEAPSEASIQSRVEYADFVQDKGAALTEFNITSRETDQKTGADITLCDIGYATEHAVYRHSAHVVFRLDPGTKEWALESIDRVGDILVEPLSYPSEEEIYAALTPNALDASDILPLPYTYEVVDKWEEGTGAAYGVRFLFDGPLFQADGRFDVIFEFDSDTEEWIFYNAVTGTEDYYTCNLEGIWKGNHSLWNQPVLLKIKSYDATLKKFDGILTLDGKETEMDGWLDCNIYTGALSLKAIESNNRALLGLAVNASIDPYLETFEGNIPFVGDYSFSRADNS